MDLKTKLTTFKTRLNLNREILNTKFINSVFMIVSVFIKCPF